MEKKTMSLMDFFNLEAELNGVNNTKTGEKLFQGLLSQKLSLKTKYWLTDLHKKVKTETDACESLKNELIKKYGEEKGDGQIGIDTFIKGDEDKQVLNTAFIEFEKEYSALLKEEREIEYKPLSINDLGDVETSENYNIIYSLIVAD